MNCGYTAISINVVGLNLQTYKSRPNGAMGIYCNLHITIEEIYKFVFLHVEYFVFLSVKPFLYLFFRRYVVWIIRFKRNEAKKKDLFYTCLKRKETKNVSFAISLYLISIQHAWNTLSSPILPFGLVFKL